MPTLTNLLGTGSSPLAAQAIMGMATAASLGLTAAGNSQGTALALTSDFNVVTTCASSAGVILPASGPNVNITDVWSVTNYGANTLSVYPPTGGKIANGSANAAFSVAAGKTALFWSIGSGNWTALLSA